MNRITVILVLIAFLFAGPGCGRDVQSLTPIQVTSYRGVSLSSADDFRENSIHGAQEVDLKTYRLEIKGLVKQPRSYTYQELIGRKSFKKAVHLECVEGWGVDILWEGFLVGDLLQDVSPDSAARTVIFRANDGYSTSFPAEYLTSNEILMGYKMNAVTLSPEHGFPFQLVAEDKWGYKWIRWVTSIELSSDEDFAGFWESRGYSNSGDLDKPFFDLVRDKGSSTTPL